MNDQASANPPSFLFSGPAETTPETFEAIERQWLADESEVVSACLAELDDGPYPSEEILGSAADLVTRVRAASKKQGALDAFMRQYDLSSQEGVLLMCLAEALLRIPDKQTAERLIKDKIEQADWESHAGKSSSLFVNASTWGLMLTGRMVRLNREVTENFREVLGKLVARSGNPAIRLALRQAMRIMGHQYVMGRTIKAALDRSKDKENRSYRHSFDMLGEAALTAADADRYFASYCEAIDAIGKAVAGRDVFDAPSISVKLSALHPRYEYAKQDRVLAELTPRLTELCGRARASGIALTVDAEEADRLELSLRVFAGSFTDPSLAGWNGLGLAVQGYQKRAPQVIEWLAELARGQGRRIPVRLVKGAYWDTEIKRCQEQGLPSYPLYTRKPATDLAYLRCAKRLLAAADAFYPQFATHNAHTVAAIAHLANGAEYEYQRLHGMGQELYEEVFASDTLKAPCRVYAPVGSHEDLLPYLVRRLLENGANTSFVNRIVDEKLPVEEIVEDPVALVRATESHPHPKIPLPRHIYGESRLNSNGINLNDRLALNRLAEEMQSSLDENWQAAPMVAGAKPQKGSWQPLFDPADRARQVGQWQAADLPLCDQAVTHALAAQPAWDATPAGRRAEILRNAADLLEQRGAAFMAIAVREAGKTIPDALAELREAIDFLRYYAAAAERDFAEPELLTGPTGESNQISLHGRGVFVCISPWNFPLAIFLGQVSAALAAGNAVVAKPAEQTPLIASKAVALLHEAGVPADVLHLVPGDGATVGAALVADERIAGVCFTGSTETAQLINRTLADRKGSIATLIAETGGQNAMLVDSSALPEQVVKDVVVSAFGSAGQRCSALRVLFVQQDIADRVIEMLAGAMNELAVGDPGLLATDVGPVIDDHARSILQQHVEQLEQHAKLLGTAPGHDALANGTYFLPRAYEIDSLSRLKREVFGPLLHVVRYDARRLDEVLESINATGYGLTLGIHTRIESRAEYIARRIRVGNCYVNRNMIGAVVGVQPFGGEGLSGTGPKAGGPNYLHRFATERTLTVNTAAVGGNASLLALSD